MTQSELVDYINKDITVGGTIPLNIPEPEIIRIIEQEERLAYKTWRDTCEVQYAVLNPSVFATADFKNSRSIQFPDCVWGINEFREIKDGSRFFGINDRDLGLDKVFGSDLFLSPFSSDIITSRTITWSWFDLAKSFNLTHISFKFNQNSHRLTVTGRTPYYPVIVQAYVGIPKESLYEDYYFQRICVAVTKQQLHRMIHTVETNNMVGGTTFISTLSDEGKNEEKEIRDMKLAQDPADWFLMTS